MIGFNEGEQGFEPTTAYDINECSTPQGIRRYAEHAVYRTRCNAALYHAFDQARVSGLSGEDKWTMIAFHALVAEERVRNELLKKMQRCVCGIVVKPL